MRKKKRNRFARLGMLSIALLVSLCVMGIGYAGWTDTVSVDGTVETTSWGGSLSNPSSQNITLSLSVAPSDTLNVGVSDAQANADYTGSFEVNNTGAVPIKIKNIVYDLPPTPNVMAIVLGVNVDDSLEPGETKYADVHTSTPDGGSSYDFTVTFTFVLWNE